MKFRYLLCILLFMICPNFVKANSCSNSDKVKYQEMAKNISITYDYVETEGAVVFSISFTNIQPGMIIKDETNDKIYHYSSNELILNGFYQGRSYKFSVYTNQNGCDNDVLYIHYVNLPHYNKYYNSELCNGIEEFKYCQKWINFTLSQYDFLNETAKYKESLNPENADAIQDSKVDIGSYIVEFYLQYYYIILPVIIGLLLIVIYSENKKNRLF